jgi:hypothetical protein
MKTDGGQRNNLGGVALKLSCTGHHSIPGAEGRCLKCGHELDQRAVTLRYRAASPSRLSYRSKRAGG